MRKGQKHSKESKLKMSNSARGKKCTEESKEKNRLSHLGRKYKPMSETGKKNISDSHREKKLSPFSERARKNMSLAKKGEKSWNWKGGITFEQKKIRKGIEFRLWREAVFARDNWTCQKCQIKGGKLHPHHIQNFAQFPKLRFAIDNGITFCKTHHIVFHKIYGKTNNTLEQILEYSKNNMEGA